MARCTAERTVHRTHEDLPQQAVQPTEGQFALDTDDEAPMKISRRHIQHEYDAIAVFAAARLLCDMGTGEGGSSADCSPAYMGSREADCHEDTDCQEATELRPARDPRISPKRKAQPRVEERRGEEEWCEEEDEPALRMRPTLAAALRRARAAAARRSPRAFPGRS